MATNFIQNDGLKNEINEKLGVLLVDMPEPSFQFLIGFM